jgi:hypothetical protein
MRNSFREKTNREQRMTDFPEDPKLLATAEPDLFFEDNTVGRCKKEVWDSSDEEIDAILAEYGIPSPCEWGKAGSYIQTTVRHQVEAERRKNDIVFIPIGCTELHGRHLPSASDTLYVSQILEGLRRFTAKRGAACSLALPPLNYGSHPYHHLGMPGTVIVRENVAREFLIDVMLGLWNDGFRKQVLINNHGHLWMLESAIQQFQKRYQTPTSSTPTSRRPRSASFSTQTWSTWTTRWTPKASAISRTATSTNQWIPSAGRAVGRRVKATSRSSFPQLLKAWSARQPGEPPKRRNARSRPS